MVDAGGKQYLQSARVNTTSMGGWGGGSLGRNTVPISRFSFSFDLMNHVIFNELQDVSDTDLSAAAQLLVMTVQISPSASFQKDLGLDSLDAVELVMAIEEEFAIEIPDSEADKILSCEDAISYISSNPMAK